MISDSPYQTGELLLTPLQGAAAGLVAAMPMLAVATALDAGSGVAVKAWLGWLGRLAPFGSPEDGPPFAAGLAVHGLIGAVLGVLYAMSQQRIPLRVLIGVGMFYGFVLWIGGRILLGWIFRTPVREVVHSWAWLGGALAFGLTLALAAGWAGARRPVAVVPKD